MTSSFASSPVSLASLTKRLAYGVRLLVVFLCLGPLAHGGEEGILSNAVEVGGIKYTVIRQQDILTLQFVPVSGGKTTTLPIRGIPAAQMAQVTDMKLALWWKRGLALVYVMKTEDKYSYALAVFPFVESNVVQPTVWISEFLESEVLYKFITVEGQFRGDSIVVVLGNFRIEDGIRKLSQGYVYIDDCPPQPPLPASLMPIGNP